MKKLLLLFIGIAVLNSLDAQTNASGLFDENNYTQIARQFDLDNSSTKHVVLLRSNTNSEYTLKKIYLDSACTKLLSKAFYKSDTLAGPFTIYRDTLVALQGTYKNGKWDGERKTYQKNYLFEKAFYNEGIKTGTWEEYTPNGQVKRRITFGSDGKVVSDIRY